MEIKVRAVGDAEQKSQQEVEQELLDKHEEKFEEEAKEDVKATEEVVEVKNNSPEKVETPSEEVEVSKEEVVELTEDDVLSHINKKYNKQINSVDELFAEKEVSEELPEDVSAYLKYKQETGRGFEDYVKLNRNIDDLGPDKLLREYLTETEEGLDENDIQDLMEEYTYNDEYDDPATIKKTKLAKKKILAKAKRYFKDQKKYYKEPLESSGDSISEEDLTKLQNLEQWTQEAERLRKENEKKQNWFTKKTNEVFGSEFKGFEFAIDNNKVTYSPGDVAELKKANSTPYNFVKKFIGEDGLLKDATGYHRALAVAMNPEKFAKFFYEQGKSQATEDVMRKTKNINMSERKAPEVTNKGGMKIRSLNQSSGRGLKIKSLRKK